MSLSKAVRLTSGRWAIPVRIEHLLTPDDLVNIFCLYAVKEAYSSEELDALRFPTAAEAEKLVRDTLRHNADGPNWWSDHQGDDLGDGEVDEWAKEAVRRAFGLLFPVEVRTSDLRRGQ